MSTKNAGLLVLFVEYGLLKDLNTAMSKYVITTSYGDPLTLTTIFALPHWALT